MDTIEFPNADTSSYTEGFGLKIEPELKKALAEIQEHAKALKKAKCKDAKDIPEAIRIQLRKLVAEYWKVHLEKSA